MGKTYVGFHKQALIGVIGISIMKNENPWVFCRFSFCMQRICSWTLSFLHACILDACYLHGCFPWSYESIITPNKEEITT